MSPNSRLPNKARASDLARMAICMALLSIVAIITFIVFSGLLRDASDSGLERRKEVAADDVQRVRIPGIGVVDYQRLFEVVSEPGESMDAFALRIGPRLRAYSDETGYEACGVLATDGELFGVVIGSNRAHIACANFNAFRPIGMKPTGQTIHSHGVDGRFHANRNDVALQGQFFAGQMGIKSVAGQKLNAFSNMDYEGGPGYLATPTGVIHQQGEGTVRQVLPEKDT